jgi:hypothetical protein
MNKRLSPQGVQPRHAEEAREVKFYNVRKDDLILSKRWQLENEHYLSVNFPMNTDSCSLCRFRTGCGCLVVFGTVAPMVLVPE